MGISGSTVACCVFMLVFYHTELCFDTGVATANCAWGNDGSMLYIAANTALFRVRTKTKGLGF